MSKNSRPVCDAPPNHIVVAVQQIGIHKPQDRRWIQVGNCSCGIFLPALVAYEFTTEDGAKEIYHVGQCENCRTIYWHRG